MNAKWLSWVVRLSVVLLLLSTSSSVTAQPLAEDLGTLFGEEANWLDKAVAVDGVVVAMNHAQLLLFDTSGGGLSPGLTVTLPDSFRIRDIAVSGRTLFANVYHLDGTVHQVRRYYIQDPWTLALENVQPISGVITEVVVHGDLMYLGGYNPQQGELIQMWRVHPAHNEWLGNVDAELQEFSLIVGGNTLVSWNDHDYEAITVMRIEADGTLTAIDDNTYPQISLAATHGDFLYVIEEYFDAEMHVYDITDPAHPVHLYSFTAEDATAQPVINDDRMVLSSYFATSVLDLSDPVHPTVLGTSFEVGGGAPCVDPVTGDVFLLTSPTALASRIQPEYPPVVLAEVLVSSHGWDIWVQGDLMAVGDSRSLLVDISDPQQPVRLGAGIEQEGFDVQLDGDRLYASGPSGGQVFDISDPFNPVQLDWFNSSSCYYVMASNGSLLLTAGYSSWRLIDIANDYSLLYAGWTEWNEQGMWFDDEHFVLLRTNVGRTYRWDGSLQQGSPSLSVPGYEGEGASVEGNILAVPARENGFKLFDCTAPLSPVELVTVPPDSGQWGWSTAMRGGILAVGEWDRVRFYDIADPAQPVHLLDIDGGYYGVQEMRFDDNGYLHILDQSTQYLINAAGLLDLHPTPTGLTIDGLSDDGTVALSWSAPTGDTPDSYVIVRNGVRIDTVATVTMQDTLPDEGWGDYTYQLRARYGLVESVSSDPADLVWEPPVAVVANPLNGQQVLPTGGQKTVRVEFTSSEPAPLPVTLYAQVETSLGTELTLASAQVVLSPGEPLVVPQFTVGAPAAAPAGLYRLQFRAVGGDGPAGVAELGMLKLEGFGGGAVASWTVAGWIGGDRGTLNSAKADVPANFALTRVHPNPANAAAVVSLALPREGTIELRVFNVLGQQVDRRQVVLAAGVHAISLPTDRYASGLYVVQASDDHGHRAFSRLLVLR